MTLPSKRISLECEVIESPALRAWLEEAIPRVGDLAINGDEPYHLTVLYLGKTSEVFQAIVRAREKFAHRPLDEERFLDAYRRWLRVHSKVMRRVISVRTDDAVALGSAPPFALVLEVDNLPPHLRDLHHLLLASFAEFLERELNVPNGAALLQTSGVFGFSGKSWVPHITVGRIGSQARIALPHQIIELGPLQIRNAASLH